MPNLKHAKAVLLTEEQAKTYAKKYGNDLLSAPKYVRILLTNRKPRSAVAQRRLNLPV